MLILIEACFLMVSVSTARIRLLISEYTGKVVKNVMSPCGKALLDILLITYVIMARMKPVICSRIVRMVI